MPWTGGNISPCRFPGRMWRLLWRSSPCRAEGDFPPSEAFSRRSHFQDAIMPLLTVIIVLIVVGVLLWLINTYIPMQSTIKGLLNAVVVIVVVLWLLQAFGLLTFL